MSANSGKRKIREFDNAKLESMVEPITVYVEKMIGGKPMEVTLPVRPGYDVAGMGWDKDSVRQLGNFLSTTWSGGGLYVCRATDSQNNTMTWECFYPIDKGFPELTPPTMVSRAAPPQPQQPPPQVAQQVSMGSPGWLASTAAAYGQPMPYGGPMAQQPPAGIYGWAPPPPVQATPFGYGYGGGLPTGTTIGAVRQSEGESVQREREERLKLQAQIERERDQRAHAEQMSRLELEMRQMREQQRQPTEDPQVAALRAQNEQLMRRLDEQQSSQQLAAIQQSTERMVTALQQTMNQQLTQITQQITAVQAQAQAAPRGPDPTMVLILETMKMQTEAQKETARAQAEAQKETARLQVEAMREQQRSAIGPREMIDISRSMSMGQEQIFGAYAKAWELMQTGIESILNSQTPPNHPALEMVGQGIQGAMQVAERYMQMREQTGAASAQAAHAQAVAKVNEQRLQMMRMQAPQQIAPAPAAAEAPPPAAEVTDEAQMFGAAAEPIGRLRMAVSKGLVNPQQAAQAIVQGIDHFLRLKAKVPVFEYWQRGDIAGLVGKILPEAQTSFKEQVAQTLFEMVKQAQQQQKPAA